MSSVINKARIGILESELETMISFYNQIAKSIPTITNKYDFELSIMHLKHYEDEIEKLEKKIEELSN